MLFEPSGNGDYRNNFNTKVLTKIGGTCYDIVDYALDAGIQARVIGRSAVNINNFWNGHFNLVDT